MDQRTRKILEDCERVFSDRRDLDSFWQEVALNFYPEMADFTILRSRGEDFAEHLSTSYPLLARRSLGDALSSLLRPVNLDTTSPGVWFSIRTHNHREDIQGRRWLEYATGIMRRAMYDRVSNFTRATKEGDHMFATFGQCPLSLELSRNRDSLLYRAWHLRDVAWTEDAEGKIDTIYRKWTPTFTQAVDTFGSKAHPKIKDALKDNPFKKADFRHVVISAAKYEQRGNDGQRLRTPWISLWLDVENEHVMEEIPSWSQIYIIPRWVTVPGSPYASSPAVTAALPDARLIQAMTLTLLDAAEKYADPPMVAQEEVLRSDLQLFAGGTTWVDSAYDERLGDAVRPLYHPNAGAGVGIGMEMRLDIRTMIERAFFLDALSLPPAAGKEMTATEVGARISEWIRRAMPIFEPMEFEYNGGLCEATFDLMMRNGAFGPVQDIPQSIRGAEIQFKFESPIHESADRKKGQKLLEAKSALVQMAELDPSTVPVLNAREALKDVLLSIGVPATWTRTDSEIEEIARQREQERAMQQMLAGGEAAAGIAADLGSATKDFAQANAA